MRRSDEAKPLWIFYVLLLLFKNKKKTLKNKKDFYQKQIEGILIVNKNKEN